MKKTLTLFAFGLLFSVFAAYAADKELLSERFSASHAVNGIPEGWKTLEFPRKKQTFYSVVKEGDNYILKAESLAAASAVYKELKADIRDYPILSWRWRVDNTIRTGDERKREGDDYGARIYVNFEYEPEKTPLMDRVTHTVAEQVYGVKPPGNALNYIWANRLKKGESAPNAFTDKVIMIAVESGDELAGTWQTEERNVYEDYKRAFGAEPPRMIGIAIMTDTDNTKEGAVAYYDDIVLRRKTQ